MKHLFFAMAFLASSLVFGQSMIVLKTGKVLTVDENGMIYDLNNFVLPYQVKTMGGRYLVDDNRKLRTIDKNGYMFSKENEDKLPVNIEIYGENFFISKLGRMFTIDEFGYMFEAEEKEREFRNVKVHGGNFLIAEKKEEGKKFLTIFTITNLGKILEVNVPGLRLENVNYVGGQYFTTTSAELFTVSGDGYVYSKKDMGKFNGWELKRGHNYFFAHGSLYTVAQTGMLMAVGKASDFGTIKHFGTNFFINTDGKVFTVSNGGNVRNVPFDQKLTDISHFSHL